MKLTQTMLLLVVSLLLNNLIIGCGSPEVINPVVTLPPHELLLNQIATNLNKIAPAPYFSQVEIHALPWWTEEDRILAVCDLLSHKIYFLESTWNTWSPAARLHILTHEYLHCAYGLAHQGEEGTILNAITNLDTIETKEEVLTQIKSTLL